MMTMSMHTCRFLMILTAQGDIATMYVGRVHAFGLTVRLIVAMRCCVDCATREARGRSF